MLTRTPAFLLVLVSIAAAGANAGTQSRQLPARKQACSMMASVISVRIVDATGKPVTDAIVRLTRLRDGKSLGTAHEMIVGSGEFEILESSAINSIPARGERIRVVARAGHRTATAVMRIGRDPTGCRLAILSGPATITLK